MKPPALIARIVFYVFAILHTPWTIIRTFTALIMKLDAWCDREIYGFINGVKREIDEERESEGGEK